MYWIGLHRGVVVPECSGTPFWQIFFSRNGAPVNVVYHSRDTDTAAFRQISSYYKKVTLYTKFGQMDLTTIIEIVATGMSYFKAKNAPRDTLRSLLPALA